MPSARAALNRVACAGRVPWRAAAAGFAVLGILSCGGDGPTPPVPPPPPPPPPPVAPVQVGTIPNQHLDTGETATLDVASFFRDPDGGALTYEAASSAPGVVSVSVSGSTLTMVGVADGAGTVTVTARDPDGLTAVQGFSVTVETPNQAPEAVGTIPNQTLQAGQTATLDVAPYFRDPEGGALTYEVASSAAAIVSVALSGSTLTMVGVGPGTATVTVTASDPGGLTAAQSLGVAVRGSIEDDFGSTASLNDWNGVNNADIAVGNGALSVTNRTPDRLGIAERASAPSVNEWTIQARMGRNARRAGPGVVSLTGHSRFTAIRLVLRTLDDGEGDRSADAARNAANYEFAVFDHDAREWIRIVNMSGLADAVSEEPGDFTDIAFGHEGGDFVAYAGAGEAEELFRLDIDSSRLDGIALREIVEHVTGVWLVNLGPVGAAALHDRIRVTGTGSGAAPPDGGEIADAIDVAGRTVRVTGPTANRVPKAVGTIPDVTIEEGASETVDLSPYFRDPDGDALTYTARVSVATVAVATVSGSDLRITALPGAAWTLVTVMARDPGGLTAAQLFRVTVTAANRFPEAVGTIPRQTVTVGDTAMVDVTPYFRDPDGDTLWYFGGGAEPGVSSAWVSGSSLLIEGLGAGSAEAFVIAQDPGGLRARQDVGVTVVTGNRAPEAVGTIPAQTIDAGSSETVDVSSYFSDPDGDALTYAASSANAAVATAAASGGRVTITAVAAGTATVTVTARDPGGLTAEQAIAVTVETGAPELTVQVTSCNGQLLPGGTTATVTVRGHVTARVRVSQVLVEALVNGQSIGVQFLGTIPAGGTRAFGRSGIISITGTTIVCEARVQWRSGSNSAAREIGATLSAPSAIPPPEPSLSRPKTAR